MFGLDDQVQRCKLSVGRVVGQNDRFARACRDAGIDKVGQQTLGGDHPRTSWSDDLETLGHRLGAVSDRSHRLRTARFIDVLDADELGGDQGTGIDATVRTGGVTMIRRGTPATTPGIVVMLTTLGNEPLPRGT